MTSSLTDLRPPPTLQPSPSRQASKRPSTAGYWVAAVVAALGLTAAFLWGALGIHTTQDRVDGFDRLAVPGATSVAVTDAGTMVVYHESAAEVARYAEPTATGRPATRWDPATRTIVTVRYPSNAPPWQQLGLSVTESGATPSSSRYPRNCPRTTSAGVSERTAWSRRAFSFGIASAPSPAGGSMASSASTWRR